MLAKCIVALTSNPPITLKRFVAILAGRRLSSLILSLSSLYLIWIGTGLLSAFSFEVRPTSDDRPATEAAIAAEGYSHNIESFSRFACEFTVADFETRDLDLAVRGVFERPLSPMIRGSWLLDGAAEKFVLDCGKSADEIKREIAAALQANPNNPTGVVAAGCLRSTFIRQGGIKAVYGDVSAVLGITPSDEGAQPNGNGLLNPLFLVFAPPKDVGTLLRSYASGAIRGRYLGSQEVHGKLTLGFEIDATELLPRRRIFVAPEKGFLPVRDDHFDSEGNLASSSYMLTIKGFPNRRWFPMRSITVLNPDSKGPLMVRNYVVNQLTVDEPISPLRFRISVPARTQVNDQTDGAAVFALAKNEEVGPKELERMVDRLRGAKEFRTRRWLCTQNASETKWRQRSVVIAAETAIVFALIWFALRRRRRATV